MLNDYEEDDIFGEPLTSSSHVKDNLSWISHSKCLSLVPSSQSKNTSQLEENVWNVDAKAANQRLLAVLCELVRAFFEAENEIQTFLKQYEERGNVNNRKSICIDPTAICTTNKNRSIQNKINRSSDESDVGVSISENETDFSIVNSQNYYEISCSYIVQLNNVRSCSSKPDRIVEDKKNYISAHINVNNCNKLLSAGQSLSSSLFEYGDEEDQENDDGGGSVDEMDCGHDESLLSGNCSEVYDLSRQSSSYQSNYSNEFQHVNELNRLRHHLSDSIVDCTSSPLNGKETDSFHSCSSADQSNQSHNNDETVADDDDDRIISLANQRLSKVIHKILNVLQYFIGNTNEGDFHAQLASNNHRLERLLTNERNRNKSIERELIEIESKRIGLNCQVNEFDQRLNQLANFKSELESIRKQILEKQFHIRNCSKSIYDLKTDAIRFDECERLPRVIELKCDLVMNEEEADEEIIFERHDFRRDYERDYHTGRPSTDNRRKLVQTILIEKSELLNRISLLGQAVEQIFNQNESINEQKRCQTSDLSLHLQSIRKQLLANKRFIDEQIVERENEKEEFGREIDVWKQLIKKKDSLICKYVDEGDNFDYDLEVINREKQDLQCKLNRLREKLELVNEKADQLRTDVQETRNRLDRRHDQQMKLNERVVKLEQLLLEEQQKTQDNRIRTVLNVYEHFEKFLDEFVVQIKSQRLHSKLADNDKLPLPPPPTTPSTPPPPPPPSDRKCQTNGKKGLLVQKSKSFVSPREKMFTGRRGRTRLPLYSTPIHGRCDDATMDSKFESGLTNRSMSTSFAGDFFVDFLAEDDVLIDKCDVYMHSDKNLNSVLSSLSEDLDFESNKEEEEEEEDDDDDDIEPDQSVRKYRPKCRRRRRRLAIDMSSSNDTAYFSMSTEELNKERSLSESECLLVDKDEQDDVHQELISRQDNVFRKMNENSVLINDYLGNLLNESIDAGQQLACVLKQNGEKETQIRLAESDNGRLCQQFHQELNCTESLQQQLNEQHLNLSGIRNQYENGHQSHRKQEEQLRDLTNRIQVKQDQLVQLEGHLNAYTDLLIQKDEELADCESQCEHTQACVDTIRDHNTLLVEANRDLRQENARLKAKIERLKVEKLLRQYGRKATTTTTTMMAKATMVAAGV